MFIIKYVNKIHLNTNAWDQPQDEHNITILMLPKLFCTKIWIGVLVQGHKKRHQRYVRQVYFPYELGNDLFPIQTNHNLNWLHGKNGCFLLVVKKFDELKSISILKQPVEVQHLNHHSFMIFMFIFFWFKFNGPHFFFDFLVFWVWFSIWKCFQFLFQGLFCYKRCITSKEKVCFPLWPFDNEITLHHWKLYKRLFEEW